MKKLAICRLAAATLAAGSALFLAGCGSTKVDRTWVAPDLTKLQFKKIMVIATIPAGASRREAEDAMKANILKIEAVQSYKVLAAEADIKNPAKVISAIKAQGFDGVVVMRGISDRDEMSLNPSAPPPPAYRTFASYFSAAYALGGYYGQTITANRILTVETNIYEMAGGKLIWSGTTATTTPGNIKQLVDDAAKAIRSEMVRKGLIPEPEKK
jgi:hypothetical protein